ncbi:MAG: LysR family transcriptional regulator [Clostridia bacterium]|nr:LysR family transcriptional regulator [Clostridia bacterium]
MNTADKYIYHVYLEQSFSAAAKALFISQPSLSATVSQKEKELGFQIFDRTKKPVTITPKGQIYLDMLEEVIESEKNMHLRLKKLSSNQKNSIRVGGGSSSAYYLMPFICGEFHRQYPSVQLNLDIGNIPGVSSTSERFSLFQKLDRDVIDTILTYNYNAGKHQEHVIHKERLVVAMHKNMMTPELAPYALTRDELLSEAFGADKEIPDKQLFQKINFLKFSKNSNTTRRMEELLGEYSVSEHVISNSVHSIVHFNMMCAGMGALLTSDCIVALSGNPSDDIVFFAFNKEISMRNIYLVTKKDAVLSKTTKNFIELAEKVCKSINKKQST